MTICTRCGDVKPDDGFKWCKVCRYKGALYRRAYYNGCDHWDCNTCPHPKCIADVKKSLKRHKNASRMSARTQKIHYRKGLCRSCNEPISPRSKFFCEKHRIKHNYNQLFINRASYVKRIRNEKLCFTCQKAPHLEDKKICEKCFQVNISNLAKAHFIQRQRRLSLKILFINFLLEKGDG